MVNLKYIAEGHQKEIWHPCVRQLGFRAFPSAKCLKVQEIRQDGNFYLVKVRDAEVGMYTITMDSPSGMVDDFYYVEEAALKVSTMRFYEKCAQNEKRPFPYVGFGFILMLVTLGFLVAIK